MLKSLLKEPLLHVLLLALAIFAVHGLVADAEEKTDNVVVSVGADGRYADKPIKVICDRYPYCDASEAVALCQNRCSSR